MPAYAVAFGVFLPDSPMDHRTPEEQLMAAFEEHSDALFRHCYLRILDRASGRAMLEECFKRTWAYLQNGQNIHDIRGFLYRVANGLIMEYRKGRLDFERAAHEAVPEDEQRFVEALEYLPEQERDVLVMRYIDKLDTPDIAVLIRVPADVVSERLAAGQIHLHSLSFHV